jgi:flagellar FliL protein
MDVAANEAGTKKFPMKKLVLLAIPLLLVAVGAGLWFSGILPPVLGIGHEEKRVASGKLGEPKPDVELQAKAPVFVDLPDLVANLSVGQRRSSFIKLKARLELARSEDQAAVAAAMPRLQDMFTTYLREMRPEELRGSAGTYRLREELIARANIAAAPAHVVNVLFIEMIVQ